MRFSQSPRPTGYAHPRGATRDHASQHRHPQRYRPHPARALLPTRSLRPVRPAPRPGQSAAVDLRPPVIRRLPTPGTRLHWFKWAPR